MIAFDVDFSEGDIIERAQDDRSRVGFYIICAENRGKVEKLIKQVKEIFKVSFK